MATSGTTTLVKSAADIVTSALRRARIIPVRQPVSSIDLSTGVEALNNMIVELRAEGWHLWKSDEYILFLQQGKTDYFLGPTGDRAVLLDNLLQSTLATATAASDTTLTIASTSGFTGSDDVLTFNPTTSTADWVVNNASVASDGTTLSITNSAVNGYAQYSSETTAGTDYFYEVDITENTGGVTLEVYSGVSVTLITSAAVAADGTQVVHFTATEASTILRIVNDNIAGDTDVDTFRIRATDTGEKVGFRVSASSREWNIVTRVTSSAILEVKNAVVDVGAVGETVVAYKNLPPKPMKIRNYRSKNITLNDEIPINTWSRSQYMQQTLKTSQGLPTQAYYNPELNNGRLYVWQTANDVNQAILFTADSPLEVIVENADDPDFPAEWFNMLSWGLASEIGPEYGVSAQRQQILDVKAGVAKETASNWDEEQGSLLIGPDNN